MAVLLISIGLILINLFTCDWLRQKIVVQLKPSLKRKLILDAVLALELCGPALEFGVILTHYGK